MIYGYILHTPYSMLLPKWCERKECVLNILFTQLFEHGKGKLITCMAQTLIHVIHVINAIIDPTEVHFEGCSIHPTSSLLQMEALANWWITMVACFFHDRFSSRAAMVEYTTIFAKSAKLRVAWATIKSIDIWFYLAYAILNVTPQRERWYVFSTSCLYNCSNTGRAIWLIA